MKVEIKTPARLHFGVLNPLDNKIRKYGGIGLAISEGGYNLTVRENDKLEVESPEEYRSLTKEIVNKIGRSCDTSTKVSIKIDKVIPRHVGLGSTTQLTLGLGKAITLIENLDISTTDLAKKLGRGKYSGVGTHAFDKGGFVGDGGVKNGGFPPLIFRHSVPKEWYFVVVIPDVERGPAEEGEERYMEGLESEKGLPGQICKLLILKMFPAIVQRDLEHFGSALTKVDKLVGEAFSHKQGGTFRDEVISRIRSYLLENGAYGAGQSSWGPTTYGLVCGKEEAKNLEKQVQSYLEEIGISGETIITTPDNEGATIAVR
ncbi:hypothetical protein AKJ52_00315 [candidate division MSBL1 archaeon SCGC-AAA382C18]|uniref:Beta-ribofuranosylaminobenzene 5'-phosphate synthase n=1 Tax=candidate division MSBL1 archaeon SCGC-AAA382C18 TaxID=1698281 RepID=A0A133VLV8_9EURY|nr:hypothetical protein AKJ52_00315 [candidate division MSBL1 archaeon SCGC-AAA382C18]